MAVYGSAPLYFMVSFNEAGSKLERRFILLASIGGYHSARSNIMGLIVRERHSLCFVRRFSSLVDSTLVLNRDLYLSSGKLNSSKKVNYDGIKPTFYKRSGYDFDSIFTCRKGIGNNRILERLEQDRQFQENISSRLVPIQNFVGSKFPLNTMEKLSVICGLSNFSIESSKYITKHKIYTESDKLRKFGQLTLSLHLGLETVFLSENYLSTSKSELLYDLSLFDCNSVIPQFMKKNMMFNSIIPFRGAMRSGKIESLDLYEETKAEILNKTSIGSLYVLIGLLSTKFDTKSIVEEILLPKIIHGPQGIINIATNNLNKGE